MGGGSKKKPISKAQPAEEHKEQAGKKEEKGKKEGKKEEKALSQYEINQDLFSALLSSLKRARVMTAFDLSSAVGVSYGLVLRALGQLEAEGKIKIISKNKRSKLYALP
ncbi:MAG: hypothetical protein ACP5UI_00465 [Thermoprotei archaeon]